MGVVVKFALVVSFAVVQTVAPWLCCCSGAEAAVRDEPVPVKESTKHKKCCSAEAVPTLQVYSCCTRQTNPSAPVADEPVKPCERCTKSAPLDPALPEPAVVPDHSNSIQIVDRVDLWLISAEANVSVRATSADPPPERLSPLHVRIHAQHAMRC